MGLHNTAHYLKSKGRGKDTELVHMTKSELKGLQDLALAHGGSLSINPDTGLVEAGFLEQILPVVAAAGLTYLTAGAAAPALAGALGTAGMGAAAATTAGGILAGAGAGALISGGVAAASGRDVGKAALYGGVGGALSGGMGAYGDANVFGIGAASAPVPTDGITNIASNTAITPDMASSLTSADTTQLNQLVAQNSSMVPQNTPLAQMSPEQFAAAGSSRFGAPVGAPDLTTGMGSPSAATLQNASNAAKTLNAPPTMYSGLGDMTRMGVQALPATGLLFEPPYKGPGQEEYDENSPYRMRLADSFQGATPIRPNPYYQANYSGYAAGGLMSGLDQSNNFPQGQQVNTQFATPTQMPTSAEVVRSDYDAPTNPYSGEAMRMNTGGSTAKEFAAYLSSTQQPAKALALGDPRIVRDDDPSTRGLNAFAAAEQRLKKLGKRSNVPIAKGVTSGIKDLGGDFSDMAAAGGTASLGGYSDGGRMLKGPGDGMSDSIPGVIGGRQPARLADGEFVVPADVVSHLGNGSTDAGAKKLYAMMDKIRKARTGKKKQAPAVKSAKYMPA
jgi:hypothetical protein